MLLDKQLKTTQDCYAEAGLQHLPGWLVQQSEQDVEKQLRCWGALPSTAPASSTPHPDREVTHWTWGAWAA